MTTASFTVLDGGMGKELLRIGAPFRQPEWSALALIEGPDFVRQAHQNFVDAGAQVIITNTYSVVPHHLGDERFAERGAELATLAARIAREVADAAGHDVQVAGSLPPLFGSYEPDNFDPERAPDLFDTLVTAQAGLVDFWLGETISSTAELGAVAAAVADRPEELWVSFTVDDDVPEGGCQLRSGESIGDGVAAALAASGRLGAILFNCSMPERITPAVALAAEALNAAGSDTPLGVYANAFVEKEEGYSSNGVILEHRDDLTPEVYAEMASGWLASGATIVGGCCGVRPDHIGALSALSAAQQPTR